MTTAPLAARLAALLGSDPGPDRGVVHVTSAWRSTTGSLRVLRIGPGTPAGDADRLVLGSVRARADVILTTGAVLRAEPVATPRLHPDPATDAALRWWRRVELAIPALPVVAVLTSGEGLDPDHPTLAWPGGVLVLTPVERAAGLLGRLRPGIEVVGIAGLSARRAVGWLSALEGVETVAVEAGPTAAGALYRPPALVDELVLSVLEAEDLPEDAVGEELPPPSLVHEILGTSFPAVTVVESGHRWTFRRYRRSPGGGR